MEYNPKKIKPFIPSINKNQIIEMEITFRREEFNLKEIFKDFHVLYEKTNKTIKDIDITVLDDEDNHIFIFDNESRNEIELSFCGNKEWIKKILDIVTIDIENGYIYLYFDDKNMVAYSEIISFNLILGK